MIALEGKPIPVAPAAAAHGNGTLGRVARRWSVGRWTHVALALVILVSASATVLAMRRTSPTFDEITTMAGGARGFHVGRFDMMENYPPLTQYLYGLPVYLSGPNYPQEVRQDTVPHRYAYAQEFLYRAGNDPERIAFLARLMAVACAALLVLVTYRFASRSFGRGAGLLAATLVAFLPDVLAHGGVAYNDVPLALTILAALWAVDATLRRPSGWRGVGAGVLVSLAVATKHSGLVMGPIAVALLAVEALARAQRRELRPWLPRIGLALLAAAASGYLAQVALYQGDFSLAVLRDAIAGAEQHISGGHGVPAYLLGRMYADAPWYFYPVAFLFKTSVALHLLMVLALAGAALVLREKGAGALRALASSPLRAPLVAALIFGAFLLRANLVIGFRYALPVLPLLCILTAAGAVALWRRTGRLLRAGIVVLAVGSALSTLAYHPHYLAYTSEYQSESELGYTVFVDSSLDWGQGLLELRDFMRREGVESVYLSYFGSGLPDGYGIDYVPLASFFPLPPRPAPATEPRFVVVSATNLVGLYLGADYFGALRAREPYAVLGQSLFVYEVDR